VTFDLADHGQRQTKTIGSAFRSPFRSAAYFFRSDAYASRIFASGAYSRGKVQIRISVQLKLIVQELVGDFGIYALLGKAVARDVDVNVVPRRIGDVVEVEAGCQWASEVGSWG
jgi:hypothetical protein